MLFSRRYCPPTFSRAILRVCRSSNARRDRVGKAQRNPYKEKKIDYPGRIATLSKAYPIPSNLDVTVKYLWSGLSCHFFQPFSPIFNGRFWANENELEESKIWTKLHMMRQTRWPKHVKDHSMHWAHCGGKCARGDWNTKKNRGRDTKSPLPSKLCRFGTRFPAPQSLYQETKLPIE